MQREMRHTRREERKSTIQEKGGLLETQCDKKWEMMKRMMKRMTEMMETVSAARRMLPKAKARRTGCPLGETRFSELFSSLRLSQGVRAAVVVYRTQLRRTLRPPLPPPNPLP
jgi:hypothetical protein